MPTFTGYTHYPGSADLYAAGQPQNFANSGAYPSLLDQWQALVNRQATIPGVSPWASTIQYLAGPGAQPAPAPIVSASSGTPSLRSAPAVTAQTGNRTLTGASASAPFQSIYAERSPDVAGVTGPLFSDWANLRAGVQQNQEEFKKAYGEFLPKSRDFATQEVGALSRYFDDSITKDLADLRAQLKEANRGLDLSDAGRYVRSTIGRRAGTGTGAPLGFNSGFARVDEGVAREFDRRAAATDAEQARRDYEFQEAAKVALLNRRREMELAQIQDVLFPQIQAAASYGSLAQAAQIPSDINLRNLITGVQTPQGIVGDSFGQAQGLHLNDLQRQEVARVNTLNALQEAQNAQYNYQLGQQQIPYAYALKRDALTKPAQSSGAPPITSNNINPRIKGNG